jgi:nickel-dependent lactate racemase
MTHPKVAAGRWRDNPVHLLMVEAARKAGVDFILNVVADEDHRPLKVVAGDLEAAWEEGVRHSARVHIVGVPEPAEVVLAGAGGYPRDINVYQTAKPLRNATRTATAEGTVVLVAECPGGYGDDTLAQWLREAHSPGEIMARFHQGFVLGGHKAFALAQVVAGREVILVSSLGEERTRRLYMTPARDLQAALGYVRQKHGDGFRALIMPQAGLVLPVLEQQETADQLPI